MYYNLCNHSSARVPADPHACGRAGVFRSTYSINASVYTVTFSTAEMFSSDESFDVLFDAEKSLFVAINEPLVVVNVTGFRRGRFKNKTDELPV